MPPDLSTCHASPWALIRRAGDTTGKRPSTRMAYLVGTVVRDGKAIAVTGYIMRNDMTGCTKAARRIEWSDIIRSWRLKPTAQTVRTIKQRLPIVTSDHAATAPPSSSHAL